MITRTSVEMELKKMADYIGYRIICINVVKRIFAWCFISYNVNACKLIVSGAGLECSNDSTYLFMTIRHLNNFSSGENTYSICLVVE